MGEFIFEQSPFIIYVSPDKIFWVIYENKMHFQKVKLLSWLTMYSHKIFTSTMAFNHGRCCGMQTWMGRHDPTDYGRPETLRWKNSAVCWLLDWHMHERLQGHDWEVMEGTCSKTYTIIELLLCAYHSSKDFAVWNFITSLWSGRCGFLCFAGKELRHIGVR